MKEEEIEKIEKKIRLGKEALERKQFHEAIVIFDEVLLWQLWNALRERGDLFLTTIIRETGIGNVRVRTYKPKEILKLLKIIGFEVLEHEVHGDHIWIHAVKEGA